MRCEAAFSKILCTPLRDSGSTIRHEALIARLTATTWLEFTHGKYCRLELGIFDPDQVALTRHSKDFIQLSQSVNQSVNELVREKLTYRDAKDR